jgi:hypothetical protein
MINILLLSIKFLDVSPANNDLMMLKKRKEGGSCSGYGKSRHSSVVKSPSAVLAAFEEHPLVSVQSGQ